VPSDLPALLYSQLTNPFGETTTTSNDIAQIVAAIPLAQPAIDYILSKYPVTSNKPPSSVKVV